MRKRYNPTTSNDDRHPKLFECRLAVLRPTKLISWDASTGHSAVRCWMATKTVIYEDLPVAWLTGKLAATTVFLALAGLQSAVVDAQDPVVVEKAVATLIHNIQVPSEEAGVVRALLVREGDEVEAGQRIVELDSEVQRLQVEVAKAELRAAELAASNTSDIEYAEKSSELSRKTMERSTQANEKSDRAVSKTEIERLQLEYERGILATQQAKMELAVAKARLTIKRAELLAANVTLSKRRIAAPIAGKVVEKLVQPGEWVSAGQPVLRMIRLDRLRVQCILPADSFDESLVGCRVEFETDVPPDGKSMTFPGVITYVSPEIILQRNQVAVWAEVENTDMKLRPNNTGQLRVFRKQIPQP